MSNIKNDIIQGQIFGSKKRVKISGEPQPVPEKKEKKEHRHKPKTMAEATAHLKSLDSKKTKNKAGTFAKGTHGSGAAKMRAEYKNRKRKKN